MPVTVTAGRPVEELRPWIEKAAAELLDGLAPATSPIVVWALGVHPERRTAAKTAQGGGPGGWKLS
ncbi:hypothetical protein AB0K09_28455, partial [Streptomyces sp. NPDC049577]|uniref:hypothetical protein n=1 Tax=Streptomyces sp. NPDC049577 TaxID=3155153 RepID=UPI0034188D6D